MEMHGGLDEHGSDGGSEKWLDLIYALKMAPRELAVELDGGYQREQSRFLRSLTREMSV